MPSSVGSSPVRLNTDLPLIGEEDYPAAPSAARACDLFAGKKLFVPGFDRDGNAVPDQLRVKVRW